MHLKAVLAALCLSALLAGSNALTNLETQELGPMNAKVILEEYVNEPTENGYKFSFRTSDGTRRNEVGILMNPGTDQEEFVVKGGYEYDSDDERIVVRYTADKNGYRQKTFKNRKYNPKVLASLVG